MRIFEIESGDCDFLDFLERFGGCETDSEGRGREFLARGAGF